MSREPKSRRPRQAVAAHVVAVALYVTLSLGLWWGVWVTGHPTSTITCNCGDPVEAVWWLAWTPWAVVHGHNPLLTNALSAGTGGVNALTNTSMLFPAAVLAPVTWLFGPIASFNVAALLSPVVSAWCGFLLARRVTRFYPGQVLAGALFGFSPFVIANDPLGHFTFVLGFFAPLAALVVYRAVRERSGSPWRLGILLGLLVVAEFFTSTEMLLIAALTAAVGGVLTLPFCWSVYRGAWSRLVRVGAGAAAVAVPLLAYPAWFAVAGPRHIEGAPWPNNTRGELLNQIVSQGPKVRATDIGLQLIGFDGPLGLPVDYLGIVLLCALAVSVVVWYRRRLAWVAAITGTASWLMSLGASRTGPYPWNWLRHLPLTADIEPQRFAEMTALCAAVLLAVSADGWWRLGRRVLVDRRLGRRWPSRRWTSRRWAVAGWAVVVTGATVGVLLPVATAYTAPFAVQNSTPPAWMADVAPTLPQGTRLLTLPYTDMPHPYAMGWQAEGGFRFDLPGGYVVVPGQGGRSDYVVPFGGATATLTTMSLGFNPRSGATARQVDGVRRALRRWGIQAVVVTPATPDPAYGATYLTAVLGRLPAYQHRSWVWRSASVTPTARTEPSAIRGCAALSTARAPLAGPRCVLATDGR